ncbi:MAG: septum site-determining protein MinD [Candidatus Eremiobacteraeota bacterium]|nr:septum site-determining protein MinD [Candidatus Eremiobacteraeota bacterium]
MGKVYVVTSGKGGVGKTTATANIGTGLALMGKKVLMIDADIGLRNLDLILGLENRIVYNIVDVLEGKCRSYRQAIVKDKRSQNLFLLAADQSKEKDAINADQMKRLCATLREDFDYVMIDCPAGIEQGFKNAIAGSDEALIVTNPEVSAVRDADRIIGLLEAEEKFNPRIVLNRYKKDMVKKNQMLSVKDVQEILGIEILGIVPEDEKILKASNKGEPAVFDKSSKAGSAYRRIVSRIIDPKSYPLSPPGDGGLFTRLKRLITKKDELQG